MKIRLLCVGKPRERSMAALHDEYAGRLGRMGVTYRSDWVDEVKPGGRFSDEHVREREGRKLLEALDTRGQVVAADRSGESWTSEELARRLERWASPHLTLVVGGPLGLHGSVLQRADRTWSLSSLTFPHELVRVLIAEQLYRGVSILRGTPYHK